jgi:hypothetical protein
MRVRRLRGLTLPQPQLLLSFIAVMIAALACAEPLQLLPTTDAPLTEGRDWSDADCGASEGGKAPASCAAGQSHGAAGCWHDDVEGLCEEHGLPAADASHSHAHRVIVDGFMFNNELDVLLVRLRELSPVVDYFVLVEADVSLSGRPKRALYAQHAQLFHAFAPRLVHVLLQASDYAEAISAVSTAAAGKKNWAWEEYSRAAISRGLLVVERLLQRSLTARDVVMVSDVDEVPSRSFARALRLCDVPLPAKMGMMFFYYSLRSAVPQRAAQRSRVTPPHVQVDVARRRLLHSDAMGSGVRGARRPSRRRRLRAAQLHALSLLLRPGRRCFGYDANVPRCADFAIPPPAPT